jgi:4-hydroxythreonine-4-phosphate dehydrogenase
MSERSRLLITMGDVAGIGPEIIARAWPSLVDLCRPTVVGDSVAMTQAVELVGSSAKVQSVPEPSDATAENVPCIQATAQDLSPVTPGQVSAAAGRAAYDFLCRAIDLTLAGKADALVTAPLHKEGLRAAGLAYPGHTEILAERCGVADYAMLLYVDGLAVAHVTLHVSLRDVFAQLSVEAIVAKIRVLYEFLTSLLGRRPRIAVAGLNPHASDGGLFGDEEARLIRPAVARAREEGIATSGPWPSDTLFVRARQSEFDGVVVMYHDQGHIAMKLLGGLRTVNVTAGLPLIRTSVAHGTAYDIAGRGLADPTSLEEAVRVAARLASRRRKPS